MSEVLRLGALSRRFGGLVAVDAVSLAVEAGEVRGLIGPNGAGKTTLLNLIGGQLRPSTGSILLDGVEVSGLRADQRAARGIRRTFQNLKLFRDMTVLQNVMVGLHSQARAEIFAALLRTREQRGEETRLAERARQVLAIVGLAEMAQRTAASLAYGHRRLLEIARAIAAGPRLLLLDEPAAGLNMSEAGELVRLIGRIRGQGITVMLVEHHMDVVMRACDRITVLNHGQLLAEGLPEQIRDHSEVREAYLGRGDLEAQVLGNV